MARHILRTLNWDIDEAPDVRRAVVENTRTVPRGEVVPHQFAVEAIEVPEDAPAAKWFRAEAAVSHSSGFVRDAGAERSFMEHVRMDEPAIGALRAWLAVQRQ